MPVAVVQVRIVRMAVAQRPVDVRMRVRLCQRPIRGVSVLVVLVVSMKMIMIQRLVDMLVLVALRNM